MPDELTGQIEWVPLNGRWNKLLRSRGELFKVNYDVDGAPAELLKGSEAAAWEDVLGRYRENRLSFFLPHGPAKGGGLDFINDWKHEVPMLVAPPRTGKSAHGVAFTLFRGIRCDPEWHCFKRHGLKYHEWRGPRKLVISSYEWSNVQELWDEYRKWCPRALLGEYAEDWGRDSDEHGRAKSLTFASGRAQRCKLTDGTVLMFLCDRQALAPWEGKRWDDGHFDEQRMEDKWISYLRGTQNTAGLVQACMTLTGYKLPGRENDTGSDGWVKQNLWDGTYSYGRTVGKYKLSVDTTPESVMTGDVKRQLKEQWVDGPRKSQDVVMQRKAEARYWGGWESGSGLVIDNFVAADHVIPDYDREHTVVQGATKYRGIDHALGGPCACAFVEVFPWGQAVMYREYYQTGYTIPLNAKGIIDASGNRRERDASFDGVDGVDSAGEYYNEVPQGETYFQTVMDSRSFASKAQEKIATIGQLYQENGLDCRPASGLPGDKLVPNMLAYLRTDKERPHIMWHFWKAGVVSDEKYREWLKDRGGDWKNGALLYFVASLRWAFIEINKWSWTQSKITGARVPKKEHDHLVGGGLKYLLAERPAYWGRLMDYGEEEAAGGAVKSNFKYIG